MVAKRWIYALLLLAVLVLVVPVAQAQRSININLIINYLGVTNKTPEMIWDILIIIAFVLGFITMLMQSDKQLLPTLLMAVTLLCLLVMKLTIRAESDGVVFLLTELDTQISGLLMLVMSVIVFIFPWMVAAMTKNGKSRPPALLAGLMGALLAVGYGIFEQGFFRQNNLVMLLEYYLF